jgi:hypothetical protein
MITIQMGVILGTIWVAPHLNPNWAKLCGCALLIISFAKELGYI